MKRLLFIVVIIILAFPISSDAASTRWKTLSRGIEYTVSKFSFGNIHAIKINPKKYRFGIVTAKAIGEIQATVKSMAKKSRALVAINGGFFTPEYKSLGLLINDGKVVNPIKMTHWWSIFFIKKDVPSIVHTNNYKEDPEISMAVQSGPRLVVDGNVPDLKPSIAERSAICINGKGEVVLVATENVLIHLKELADYLRGDESKGGLGCRFALNLDGGGSTQLYVNVGSFELDVPGINKVANAVVVYPRGE